MKLLAKYGQGNKPQTCSPTLTCLLTLTLETKFEFGLEATCTVLILMLEALEVCADDLKVMPNLEHSILVSPNIVAAVGWFGQFPLQDYICV